MSLYKAFLKSKTHLVGVRVQKSKLDNFKDVCFCKDIRPQTKCPPTFDMLVCGEYVYNIMS